MAEKKEGAAPGAEKPKRRSNVPSESIKLGPAESVAFARAALQFGKGRAGKARLSQALAPAISALFKGEAREQGSGLEEIVLEEVRRGLRGEPAS